MKSLLAILLATACATLALAQTADTTPLTLLTTVETGEELPVIAAWAPDGQRLAYGTEAEMSRREISVKEDRESYTYPGEVWVTDFQKKPERVLKRKRFRDYEGGIPSFSVTRVEWAPDGSKLAVELRDPAGETATFLLTPGGKAVKIGGERGNMVDGYQAGWLGDSESLPQLHEALKPRLLHRVSLLRVTGGRNLPLFREKTFSAAAWLPESHRAALIEQDKDFADPPRLVVGNLDNGTLEPIDELSDGYLGGLQAGPDESHVSYFVGQEKLAVRALTPKSEVSTIPVPLGRYQWLDENRILFVEPDDIGSRKGWLSLYDRGTDSKQRLLPETKVYDFWVTREGTKLAALTADQSPQLRIYQLNLGLK